MSENKPPMAICLELDYLVGPYVHINQFLAEVNRRANELAAEGLSFDREFVDISFQLAEELKEGEA